MELSCPFGIRALSRKENLSWFGVLSQLINPLLTKLVRSKWLDIGYILACLWTETKSRSINTQEKNLANIQPSRPHAWSITHVYNQSSLQHEVAFLMNPHLTVQKRRSWFIPQWGLYSLPWLYRYVRARNVLFLKRLGHGF